MKNKLWFAPEMLSKVLDDVFEDDAASKTDNMPSEAVGGTEKAFGHREPPACYLEEITGEYVLIFPSWNDTNALGPHTREGRGP